MSCVGYPPAWLLWFMIVVWAGAVVLGLTPYLVQGLLTFIDAVTPGGRGPV